MLHTIINFLLVVIIAILGMIIGYKYIFRKYIFGNKYDEYMKKIPLIGDYLVSENFTTTPSTYKNNIQRYALPNVSGTRSGTKVHGHGKKCTMAKFTGASYDPCNIWKKPGFLKHLGGEEKVDHIKMLNDEDEKKAETYRKLSKPIMNKMMHNLDNKNKLQLLLQREKKHKMALSEMFPVAV
jgi:hypothetical protein